MDDGTGGGGTDDDRPVLAVSNVSVTEGTDAYAVFSVSLSNLSTTAVSFNLALADVSAVGGGTDYGSGGAGNLEVSTDGGVVWNDATSATIAAGSTSILVRTPVVNDTLDENAETFTLTATRTAGITTNASAAGTGTIVDNDLPPGISIDDVSVNESAGTATFTVSLSTASGLPVSVGYSMTDGTALGVTDYTAGSGVLNFTPGATTQTITVPITADLLDELDETFTVNLAGAVNATITDATGTGTILDDDPPPSISIDDVSVNEGAGTATFTVTLSGASGLPVSVGYSMADGTALDGTDYTAGTGVLNFTPGTTTQTITVPIIEDALDEVDETFTVNLSAPVNATIADGAGTGTIVDNDGAPVLTINDVTRNEAAGTMTFTVSLSAVSGLPVSVNFATADGTATAGLDYTATSGVLNFAPGETTQTVTVPILNDTLFEQSETLSLNLSGAVNAGIADATGAGTILDDGTGGGGTDDDTPTLSVGNVSTVEGTDPFAVFSVSLSNASTTPVTFNLTLANVSALGSGTDYGTGGVGNLQVSTDGGLIWTDATSATIAAGSTSILVQTPITDDVVNETTETFTLTATVTGGVTTNPAATGTGTIVDPDNSLSGFVYVDANNNGIFDSGEAPVVGATVSLSGTDDLSAPVARTAFTNGSGLYEFLNLRPGTYTISGTQPGGLLDGRDSVGTLGGALGNDTVSAITTLAGQTGTGYNFGELEPASLAGTVFQDIDLDGVFSPGDTLLPGVNVTLTGIDDRGGSVNITLATNPSGAFTFTGLRPGTYTLTESQPAGLNDGADTVGTAGGVLSANDVISGITLASGVSGTGYSFAEIFPFDPVKTVVATNNPGTSGPNVSIGEVIRYRLVVSLPDGLSRGFTIEDQIPAGLTFLDDGTATVALVSLGGSGVTSSTLSGPGLAGTDPNAAPTFLLPGTAISSSLTADVDAYASGTDVFFKLGDLTNIETGIAGGQYAVVEFNARVDNTPANQSGVPLGNSFRPLIDLDGNGTSDVIPGGIASPPATVTVAEPVLFVDKVLAGGSATPRPGDTLTFTVTIGHAAGSNATAWEVVFADTLPAGLQLESVVTTANGGAVVSSAVSPGANGALAGQFDIPVGGEIVVTYRVTVVASVPANSTFVNTADVTWTSLPGDVPAERRSGDSLLGGGGLNDLQVRDSVTVSPVVQPAAIVQQLYAFDTFNDFSRDEIDREVPGLLGFGVRSPDNYRAPLLPLAPIYSGEAEPGSTLVITLYNTKGEIIGTQTVIVDAGGNWMANFPSTVIRDYPNSVHIAQSNAFYSLSDPHGFNLRTYFSPALNPGHFMFEQLRQISEGGPAPLLGDLGLRNPLRLGAVKFAGELLGASATPGGY